MNFTAESNPTSSLRIGYIVQQYSHDQVAACLTTLQVGCGLNVRGSLHASLIGLHGMPNVSIVSIDDESVNLGINGTIMRSMLGDDTVDILMMPLFITRFVKVSLVFFKKNWKNSATDSALA